MSVQARERLAQLAPKTIAYVSCDPDTLARDLDHFSRLGYAAERLQPIDMIPLTEEIETVATLRQAGAATPPSGKPFCSRTKTSSPWRKRRTKKCARSKSASENFRIPKNADFAHCARSIDERRCTLRAHRADRLDAWAERAARARMRSLRSSLVVAGSPREKEGDFARHTKNTPDDKLRRVIGVSRSSAVIRSCA